MFRKLHFSPHLGSIYSPFLLSKMMISRYKSMPWEHSLLFSTKVFSTTLFISPDNFYEKMEQYLPRC